MRYTNPGNARESQRASEQEYQQAYLDYFSHPRAHLKQNFDNLFEDGQQTAVVHTDAAFEQRQQTLHLRNSNQQSAISNRQ
jgi:hypothetical protein